MKRPIVILLALLSSFALGQLPAGPDPSAVATEAVRDWLEQEPVDLMALAGLPPEEVCRQLPALVQAPPPPAGTEVNLDDQRALDTGDPELRRYTYPASLPGGALRLVEVSLERDNGLWRATAVGFQIEAGTSTIPAFVHGPLASWAFVLFSLYLLYLLATPSFFRRWLAEGWALLKQHRRTAIGTVVLFYGLFALGTLGGAALPQDCRDAIGAFLETSLDELGATDAYASGNVPRAAVVTFYQNFVWGTLITTFSLAFLFAVPAYLLNAVRFFSLGVPFGFSGALDPLSLLAVMILLVVELMAYILVTIGGGMMLLTLVRQGFSAFSEGYRKLVMMLPLALLLLVIGAWYEASVIILPALLAGPA